ncbi:MAG: hypothetical protein ACI9BD_000261 [Candidatus Marinamargulisbacteria bacterium]
MLFLRKARPNDKMGVVKYSRLGSRVEGSDVGHAELFRNRFDFGQS